MHNGISLFFLGQYALSEFGFACKSALDLGSVGDFSDGDCGENGAAVDAEWQSVFCEVGCGLA